MRKTILLLMCSLVFTLVSAQEDKGLARVKKMSGIELYVYSEPLRDYEVVGKINSESLDEILGAIGTGLKSLTDNDRASDVKCYTMQERIKTMVDKALKMKTRKKNPIDFDAIIIDNDQDAVLIKFTE